MEKITKSWERLQTVIESSGLSVNGFAHQIGLSRGENLYQIKKGNNDISKDLAQRINDRYPQYSVGWLITGIPEMPQSIVGQSQTVRIPLYYNYTTVDFPLEDQPDDYLILSTSAANGAEVAVAYSDDILNPYLRGAFLLLRKHQDVEPILFGNIYLVRLRKLHLFRIIKKYERNPTVVTLTTVQPSTARQANVCRAQWVVRFLPMLQITDNSFK